MCIRGYPRSICYTKLSLESLNSIPILYLWLANCLFLYLGFKVNDLGLFASISPAERLREGKASVRFWNAGKLPLSDPCLDGQQSERERDRRPAAKTGAGARVGKVTEGRVG